MRQERMGTRDLTYSAWHRQLEDDLTYIDIDAVEYCRRCREPLALIETARNVGQPFKATTVLRHVARKATVPAYLVLYEVDDLGHIKEFTVRMVSPTFGTWLHMAPDQFHWILRGLRDIHHCNGRLNAS